ncbi:CoA pyrophosphatase [Pelomonas sp. KK5]|uniref:CoA pyrophosphatase n=1 Tax=Pelomonas sp. KK5 TaxID=1855730 RepID=UPI00097BC4CC|nr:CoA pyrophosphatase [Pelomonas sp. KK5]
MIRPPILNASAQPVEGTDAHLPAVPADRLTPDALRSRFADPPLWQPEFPGDGGVFANKPPAAASVLIPLVMRPEGVTVLLTKRTDHLRAHAGQISFPGGRAEPDDADPRATALRETLEEIGLEARFIDIIGSLPLYATVTSFHVTPIIALVSPGFTLALDGFEVAEAFEVPLAFLMDPSQHQRRRFEFDGGTRHFLSMPWVEGGTEYFIWGATASMLRNLYRFLSA